MKRISVFRMRCDAVFSGISSELIQRPIVVRASEKVFLLSTRSADYTAARSAVACEIEYADLKIRMTHLKISCEFEAVCTIDCNLCLAASVFCLHRCYRRVVEDCLCFDVRIELEVDVTLEVIPTASLDSGYGVLVYLDEERSCVLSSSEFWHYLDSLFPAGKPVCMIPIHIL